MAEQFYTLVTNVGKAKIANANALGTKVNFSILKVGDSNGNYYEPTESQEDLVHTVWSGNINSIAIDPDNPNWIVIDTVIPSNVGGFTIREAGIFDIDGNLLAIAKYPETYKPVAENGATKDLTIENILEVSNTAVVTLKVDPTVILATKDDLNNVKKDVDNLSTQMADIAYSGSGIYRNAIINGNFDIWQRGTIFENIQNNDRFFTADHFGFGASKNTYMKPNITISKGSNILINNMLCNTLNLTVDSSGSGEISPDDKCAIYHRIENGTRLLCGSDKDLRFSFWGKSTIDNQKININLSQRYGTGGEPSNDEDLCDKEIILTTSWKQYVIIIDTNTLERKTFGTNNDDFLQIKFEFIYDSSIHGTAISFIGAETISFAQIQLNASYINLPFLSRGYAEELRLCQRYFQPCGAGMTGIAIDTNHIRLCNFNYGVSKRIYPYIYINPNYNDVFALNALKDLTSIKSENPDCNIVVQSILTIPSVTISGFSDLNIGDEYVLLYNYLCSDAEI